MTIDLSMLNETDEEKRLRILRDSVAANDEELSKLHTFLNVISYSSIKEAAEENLVERVRLAETICTLAKKIQNTLKEEEK